MDTKPKRPLRHARDYAQAIVDAHGDVAAQRAIFEACPMELRSLARELAKSALSMLEVKLAQHQSHQHLVQSARQHQPDSSAPQPGISQLTKSAPEVGNAHLANLRACLARPEDHHA
jgi:hypothetical protein